MDLGARAMMTEQADEDLFRHKDLFLWVDKLLRYT